MGPLPDPQENVVGLSCADKPELQWLHESVMSRSHLFASTLTILWFTAVFPSGYRARFYLRFLRQTDPHRGFTSLHSYCILPHNTASVWQHLALVKRSWLWVRCWTLRVLINYLCWSVTVRFSRPVLIRFFLFLIFSFLSSLNILYTAILSQISSKEFLLSLRMPLHLTNGFLSWPHFLRHWSLHGHYLLPYLVYSQLHPLVVQNCRPNTPGFTIFRIDLVQGER